MHSTQELLLQSSSFEEGLHTHSAHVRPSGSEVAEHQNHSGLCRNSATNVEFTDIMFGDATAQDSYYSHFLFVGSHNRVWLSIVLVLMCCKTGLKKRSVENEKTLSQVAVGFRLCFYRKSAEIVLSSLFCH